MTRCSLRACLAAGMLLGTLILCPHTEAKPPDLPAKPADTVTPPGPAEESTWESLGGVQSSEDMGDGVSIAVGLALDLGLLLDFYPALVYYLFSLEPPATAAPKTTPATPVRMKATKPARVSVRFGLGCNRNLGLTGSVVLAPGVVMKATASGRVQSQNLCAAMADCARRTLSPIRPTARQRLASCLIFGINPLFALARTDELLDCPGDHPAPPARPAVQTYHFICGLSPAPPQTGTSAVTQRPADRQERLQAGRRLLTIGEQLGRMGHLCEAIDCFEIVEMLCPGRYDVQLSEAASKVFAQLTEEVAKEEAAGQQAARMTGRRTGRDNATPSACPKCEALHARYCQRHAKPRAAVAGAAEVQEDRERAGVNEQVTGLMKACHLAIEDGRYERAAELAHEAFVLDPERVLGDPLVYKMQLLSRQPKVKVRPAPANGPGANARPVPFLQPALPAVDPQVVNGLDEQLQAAQPDERTTRPAARKVERTEEQEDTSAPASPPHYPLCREPARDDAAQAEEGGMLFGLLDGILEAAPLGGKIALGLDEVGILFACDMPIGRSIYHVRYVRGVPAFFVTANGAASDEPQ